MWRVPVQRILFGSLVLVAIAGPAQAGTPPGTAVTISGLDDLSATVDAQAKNGSGKALAILMGLGGLAMLAAGRPGIGIGGLGAGVAMAFVPNIIGTAFDATAAAPVLPVATALSSAWSAAWWTPLLAALYPVLLGVRVLQDPIVLSCLALACALRLGWAARPHALALR
jgi:hypothetical protein